MRHPRLRFTLKALLAAVLVFSLGLTALSLVTARARQQARAVQQLEAAGATIYYDFHHFEDPTRGGSLSGSREPDNWIWLRVILGHDFFSTVYQVQFTDLHWFTDPRHTFGPATVQTTASRKADHYISLLAPIEGMDYLDLESCNVTDAAIPALANLQTLKHLRLNDTYVSREGFEELQRQMPNCDIYWRPKFIPPAASPSVAPVLNQNGLSDSPAN